MSYQDIIVTDFDGIRTITLNRPEAGNKLRDLGSGSSRRCERRS